MKNIAFVAVRMSSNRLTEIIAMNNPE